MSIDGDARELMLLDQVERALASAQTFDELREIRDKAEAARTYAKAARAGLELQNRAAEIKLRAERKAGSILAGMRLRGGDRRSKSHNASLKLRDLGITRDQSRRWQHQAAVPEREFQNYINTAQAEGREVTSAGLLRVAAALRHGEGTIIQTRRRRGRAVLKDSTAGSAAAQLLSELAHHREELAQILRPLFEDEAVSLSANDRKTIRELLVQMQELVGRLRELSPQ